MELTINGAEHSIDEDIGALMILVSKERDAYKNALEQLSKLGNGGIRGNSDGNILAQRALDTFS